MSDVRVPRETTEWQRCPVCQGRGWVPYGFYTGLSVSTHTNNDECRRCDGTGTILPPVLGSCVRSVKDDE